MRGIIDKVEQRARRYWAEDGLAEMASGCILILVGLLFFLQASAPPGSLPASFSAIGLPILLVLGIWAARYAVTAAKMRLTYPRTGYVSLRRPPNSRRILAGIIAGLMGGLVAALLRSAPASLAWIPALNGLVIGCFLLYFGHMLGILRFYLLALLSVSVGGAASLVGWGDTLGSAVYFGILGLGLIASGGLALHTYLTHTMPPAGDGYGQ